MREGGLRGDGGSLEVLLLPLSVVSAIERFSARRELGLSRGIGHLDARGGLDPAVRGHGGESGVPAQLLPKLWVAGSEIKSEQKVLGDPEWNPGLGSWAQTTGEHILG